MTSSRTPRTTELLTKSRPYAVAAGPYLLAAVLSLLCAYFVLQLWRMTWSIPLYYGHGGDVFGIYSMVKSMSENPWFLDVPQLAAPFGAHWEDFPLPNVLHLAVLRVLVLVFHDYAVAVNLYYLAFFPLSALIALYALRRLSISTTTAIAVALLFSCLPARFERQQAHLFYAGYYLAPLIVLIAVWLIRDHDLFDVRSRRPTRDGWIAAAAALLVSWDNPYFVLFAAVLFMMGAAVAFWSRRRWLGPASALALMLIMGAGLFVAFWPTTDYKVLHGPNSAAVVRYPEAAELYALTLIQVVLPIEHHRISGWAEKRDYYDTRMAWLANENSTASLGLLGAAGVVGLLGGFLLVRRSREDLLWPDLSRLTLAAFLFATIGGIGAILSFYYVPEFRAYNRIAPIVGFLGLIAVALTLEAARRRIGWPQFQVRYVALLTAIVVFGIADQTSEFFVPAYDQGAAHYRADEAFARTVESTLPKGASVLQLPVMRYPESPRVGSLASYDELAMFLHTDSIRWSFGGMSGRPEGEWASLMATKPPRELVAAALIAGFSAVAVYRSGYADNGAEIERQLASITGAKPQILADGAIAFFPMASLAQRVDRLLGTRAAEIRSSLAPAITLDYGPSFYPEEAQNQRRWRWASSDGEITVHNGASAAARAVITFTAAGTAARQNLSIATSDPSTTQSVTMTPEGTLATIDHVFPAGDSALHFKTGSPPVKIGADPRALSFRLIDVMLHDPNEQLRAQIAASLSNPGAAAPGRSSAVNGTPAPPPAVSAAPVATATSPPSGPLSLRYGAGFYGEEAGDGHTWHWASEPTEIVVHNGDKRPVKGRLSLTASGVGEAGATVKVSIAGRDAMVKPLTMGGPKLDIARAFAPGDTPIRFEPSSRPTKIGEDPRTFSFRVNDVSLTR